MIVMTQLIESRGTKTYAVKICSVRCRNIVAAAKLLRAEWGNAHIKDAVDYEKSRRRQFQSGSGIGGTG